MAAASQCCPFELPPRQPSTTCDQTAAGSESAALSQREERSRAGTPAWPSCHNLHGTKARVASQLLPLSSSPPRLFNLLYQDIVAYAFMTDVQWRRKPGWYWAPVSINKTSLSTLRPLTCCLPGSVCHRSPPCSLQNRNISNLCQCVANGIRQMAIRLPIILIHWNYHCLLNSS